MKLCIQMHDWYYKFEIQSILSSIVLFKNLKIKICTSVILPFFFSVDANFGLICRGFVNEVLRKVTGM
jgi:hypothetical protein